MKTWKSFIQKNGKSLAVPLLMIILGLIFAFARANALSVTVRIVGVVLILAGAYLGCTLISLFSPLVLTSAILIAVFGILCLAMPGPISNFLVRILGIIVLVNGLMRTGDAYAIKGKSDDFVKYMISDVVTAVIGLVMIFLPGEMSSAFSIILGVILIVAGVLQLITAFRVFRDGKYVDGEGSVVWEEDGKEVEGK